MDNTTEKKIEEEEEEEDDIDALLDDEEIIIQRRPNLYNRTTQDGSRARHASDASALISHKVQRPENMQPGMTNLSNKK